MAREPVSTDPMHELSEPARRHPADAFYARAFAVATAVALGIAFYRIIEPFAGPIVWATFIAFLLHPLHVRLKRRLRGRGHLSALLLAIAALIVIIGPLTGLGIVFAAQAADLVERLQGLVTDGSLAQAHELKSVQFLDSLLGWLNDTVGVTAAQVQGWAIEGARKLLQGMASVGGRAVLGAVGTIVGLSLMLFLLYFFIRDGEEMLRVGRQLIPLPQSRKEQLFEHLAAVTRAVVFGTGLTALIQGSLVGIAFAIVGLPSPLVFGVLAVLFALLPFAGSALVWAPAVMVLAAQGRWVAAIFLLAWGALLVGTIDNLLRPMLISGRAQVATLTVFLGVLGGVSAFGTIGLFLGPVVLALILALIRFALEVRGEVDSTPPPESP